MAQPEYEKTYFPRTESGIDFKSGGKFKFDHCLEINLDHEGTLQEKFSPRVPKISLAGSILGSLRSMRVP